MYKVFPSLRSQPTSETHHTHSGTTWQAARRPQIILHTVLRIDARERTEIHSLPLYIYRFIQYYTQYTVHIAFPCISTGLLQYYTQYTVHIALPCIATGLLQYYTQYTVHIVFPCISTGFTTITFSIDRN